MTPTTVADVRDWPVGLPRPRVGHLLKGGNVATTWRARLADGADVVVKVCPFPVDGEVDGLRALASAGVPVPAVLGWQGGTLVLEFVEGRPDWEALGAAVAGMHRVSGRGYGWHADNRMGRFVQPNAWMSDWASFFVERRIRPHLADPELPPSLRLRLERACEGPIQDELPTHPVPSLTHGDFWRGNVVSGRWVVDPEVSLTDRELDLANMLRTREDPLPGAFWAGYSSVWELPEDFARRATILGLHHSLLGVRHFGPAGLARLARDLTDLGW